MNNTKKKSYHLRDRIFALEAPPRIELGVRALQAPALPLGHGAVFGFKKMGRINKPLCVRWSGLRGSNSLPPPWQGGALPDELNPHFHGASGRNRTNDTGIFSPLLYRLSYRGKWRPGWGSNPRPLA